ncbi:DNA-formamidopyrimidine glycosylase family protein [Adhaeribacter radiodurans]|uniref:Endonuclease n=1 Tax=Adhaeribacter radiodurans TaxID=2745197 RepID=A0A7L7L615_9BACT|nr:DNA-formamidopyrimidine glycosylase family protein [Adhaeribacter radiodurans]QMU28230.1 endonuclease [Adhaeribacter radiodurans]
MPEGPQIIILKEQLEQYVGQEILEAKGTVKNIPVQNLKNQILTEIKTYGKVLLLCFPTFTIRIHLMLFGKYAINQELNRELRLGFTFETGEVNFYACDCRLISEHLNQVYDWSTDVMHPSFNQVKVLEKFYCHPERLICDALLDQKILAGVGNGIKNEVLFRTHIHPASLMGQVPEAALKNLIRTCVTFSKEYLSWKQEGTEKENWQVYQQRVCLRDQVPLRKEKIGKPVRSCYFCEKCQVLYSSCVF